MLPWMVSPIQIRRLDVVSDIRDLAALKQVSMTAAVAEAVRTELAEARREAEIQAKRRDVRRLVDEFHRLPRVGPLLTDDDLYDEDGFPK